MQAHSPAADSKATSHTEARHGSAWPFAPLTDHQLSQRDATERALQSGGMACFVRAFADTVFGDAL